MSGGVPVFRLKRDCKVCALEPGPRAEVNAAIWQGRERVRDYRRAGCRAYEAGGGTIDPKAITRHAEHVEESWRTATVDDPAAGRERPVFPNDYESLTDKAAVIGASALDAIERRIATGELPARELLNAAKLGLGARQKQKELEQGQRRPEIALLAIIGLASGHVQLPEAEVIEVVDPEALKAQVQEERRLLEARSVRADED